MRRAIVLQLWSGERDWPTKEEWERLRAADELYEEQLGDRVAHVGTLELAIELPMPGVARLPVDPRR